MFYDEYARQYSDEDNADKEARFIMSGISIQPRLLVVCHCERGEGDVVRIISALTPRGAALIEQARPDAAGRRRRFGQALAAVPDPVIAYLRSQQDVALNAAPGREQ